MTTNDQDARALTYLARRLRTETSGAGDWDEAGTWAVISRLIGQNLAITIERVTRHAGDANAKTPGAITRPFTPDVPTTGAPRAPRRETQCNACGAELEHCECGYASSRRPAPLPPEVLAERVAAAKAALRGER